MRDPVKSTLARGATTLANAMQNYGVGRYALVESIVGEKPHAVVIAATEDHPGMLRALLRVVRKYQPAPPPPEESR